ncbi:ABC transporter permease [Natronocalculus amylovorans]|uniref:ABC transporter permease n=1 Tax=Natronocalculus amylovorans TaxID=2917812 RepID=A0AAE3FYC6_9EURY|nr:ABC transporter permease [Natronocalculus amylovorans]MCL9817627.1 ABC transporter permease [Natronocalculus amylovorans]NUE02458.1 ABC transporter permease [Halorubraceae archaeon YAN]
MSRIRRIRAEATAGWHSFLRRRTAVFFTFFFPVILVVIFGALVRTQPTEGGLFAEPAAYYIPGYLATVVLFTPLSRVGSEVARYRDGNRFEKLATTPLTRAEWLLAQTLVNIAIIGLASLLILGLVVAITAATLPVTIELLWLIPLIVLGVILFCGVGAILGRLSDSQDGAVAASNTIALPLLFLSDTFIPLELLPTWFIPAIELSPLTYFSRGVRAVTFPAAGDTLFPSIAILAGLAGVIFAIGAYAIPQTD